MGLADCWNGLGRGIRRDEEYKRWRSGRREAGERGKEKEETRE